MKKLIILLFLVLLSLLSCDGRYRVYKSNAEVLQYSNSLRSFSRQSKNVPSKPLEIFTDTILTNGFQVRLKFSSIENVSISKKTQSKRDSLINMNYKNFEAKVQVLRNGNIIVEETLNKAKFSKFDSSPFWKHAIMQFVWIDYDTLSKDHINLITTFCLSDSDFCKDYNIRINSFGSIEIKEIDLTSQVF